MAHCDFCDQEVDYLIEFNHYPIVRCGTCKHLGIIKGPTMSLGSFITSNWAVADKEVLMVLDENKVKPSELF